MHGEMNRNYCFNNFIQMIVKICEIAQFTRATPGSSLVENIKIKRERIGLSLFDCIYLKKINEIFNTLFKMISIFQASHLLDWLRIRKKA